MFVGSGCCARLLVLACTLPASGLALAPSAGAAPVFHARSPSRSAPVDEENTIAVAIHETDGASPDVSVDPRSFAPDVSRAAAVTRGPYLQAGTPTGVTVRWRTSVATDSLVRYGTSLAALTSEAGSAVSTTEHEVALSGLLPGTTYYYSVGTSAGTLTGGDAATFFVTSPPAGASRPLRVWVLGDSGTANANAQAVRDAYYAFTGSTHTNLWLMLGDNAYNAGTDAEYQTAVFTMYPEMLRKSVLWPTIGNHDTAQSTDPPSSLPYFSIFTLPTGGEAGGTPSGTERYYSFDHGDVHFICLDSMTSDRSPTGPMLTWLRYDLASTGAKWIVAFWHHPPYSKGSHDSDAELQLFEMRQNALPILEEGGVDLVLAGHSHSYERSFLIDGHYGPSMTFKRSMKKDGGSGRENGTGAYVKPTGTDGANQGAVYAVAGSSGQTGGGPHNHPAMFISLNHLGSMVLDFDGSRLDAKFLRENGMVADYFTIRKASAAPTNLTATAVSPGRIDLAWSDNSNDETAFEIERSTDRTSFVLIATVAPNVTAFANGGLSQSTTYAYRVRAIGASDASAYSNSANATTESGPARRRPARR